MQEKTIDDVRSFWEENPLFTGESHHAPGTKEYFEEHRRVCIQDCSAGELDPRIFPSEFNAENVLDLGCGPGFWVIELAARGAKRITAGDLTETAVQLTQKRAAIYGVQATVQQENAERLSFEDNTFTHINCQGVIHHTPNTEGCVAEIARVLHSNGTAVISVYYKNIFLRCWPALRLLGKALSRLGAGLKGRGREGIYGESDSNEIVRLYDGDKNPIGKAYSEAEFRYMLEQHFKVEDIFFHFFPARSLPFPIPVWLHRFLDRYFGFMIFAKCRKL